MVCRQKRRVNTSLQPRKRFLLQRTAVSSLSSSIILIWHLAALSSDYRSMSESSRKIWVYAKNIRQTILDALLSLTSLGKTGTRSFRMGNPNLVNFPYLGRSFFGSARRVSYRACGNGIPLFRESCSAPSGCFIPLCVVFSKIPLWWVIFASNVWQVCRIWKNWWKRKVFRSQRRKKVRNQRHLSFSSAIHNTSLAYCWDYQINLCWYSYYSHFRPCSGTIGFD